VFGAGEPSREDRAQDGCLMPLHGVDMIWGSGFGTRHSGSALRTWARHSDYRAGVQGHLFGPASAGLRAPGPGSVFNSEAL
jgi:hypothetical protein